MTNGMEARNLFIKGEGRRSPPPLATLGIRFGQVLLLGGTGEFGLSRGNVQDEPQIILVVFACSGREREVSGLKRECTSKRSLM